jgi:uncharacterized protein (DUF1501 family)
MLTRRDLLRASASSVALAGLPAGVKVAFAATGAPLLVVVFLRGAADLLSLVSPSGNAEYQAARPTLAIPATGTGAGIPLAGALNGQAFQLHPAATGLAALYGAGQLAVIHATGLVSTNRSHFQSQEMMERGYADAETPPSSGWLARHLALSAVGGQVPIVAAASEAPMALMGEMRAVSMTTPASFRVSGGRRNEQVLAKLAARQGQRALVMRNTLEAVARITAAAAAAADRMAVTQADDGDDDMAMGMSPGMSSPGMSSPDMNPGMSMGMMAPAMADADDAPVAAAAVDYGSGELATALKTIADIAKAEIGLAVATADFGGWDTHDAQAGRFSTQATRLSQALAALHADLAALGDRLTVVVMSEFGRRLVENQNRGTDHGHGSVMLVSGVGIKGGLYGTWPGLKAAALDQGLDLAITTDYRRVLAEVLAKRAGQTRIADVFPTVSGVPLGLA